MPQTWFFIFNMKFFTKTSDKNNNGFTLVEVLVSAAIMAIIAGFAVAGFQNFARFQQYNQAVTDVRFLLETVRERAVSAEDDSEHSLRINSSELIQFAGNTYSMSDPDNEVSTYELVTFSADLNTAGSEIVFQKVTGLPSATGTITITGVQYPASTTFTLTDTGVVQ